MDGLNEGLLVNWGGRDGYKEGGVVPPIMLGEKDGLNDGLLVNWGGREGYLVGGKVTGGIVDGEMVGGFDGI
jgi:hypothetical protein